MMPARIGSPRSAAVSATSLTSGGVICRRSSGKTGSSVRLAVTTHPSWPDGNISSRDEHHTKA